MSLFKRDINELRFNSLHLLSKQGNGDYYKQLFRNARMFFLGMGRRDLVEILDRIIYEKIERIMGTDINMVLLVYKNITILNGTMRSRNPAYQDIEIYKFTIEAWLDEIEAWIFENVIALEGQIRFTTSARQWI